MFNLCSNNNISNFKKQDSNLNSLQSFPELPYSLPLHEFTQADYDIMNYLYYMGDRYSNLFPSQNRMGEKLGYARPYVNQRIKILCDKKIIVKITKFVGPKKSMSFYRLTPLISRSKIRELFSWSFKTFKTLSIAWSLSAYNYLMPTENIKPISKNLTLIKVSYLYNSSCSSSLSSNISLAPKKNLKIQKSEVIKNSTCIGNSMNAQTNFNVPLSQIKELVKNRLNLTPTGIIDIHMYSDQALMHALGTYKSNKNKEQEYKSFCSEAHKWHIDNRILKSMEERSTLEKAFPELMGLPKVNLPEKTSYSSFKNRTEQGPKKINYKIINPDVNLAEYGRNEQVRQDAKWREERRAAVAAKKAARPDHIETQEEAIANVDNWLKSPEGVALQNKLGPLTNPFRNKEYETPKESKVNKSMIHNLQSALNFIKDQDYDSFTDY